MISIAEQVLADIVPAPKDGFRRFIRRQPIGVALMLAPWNYPWLTAVNAVIPALMAGNSMILKHSDQRRWWPNGLPRPPAPLDVR